MESKISLNKIAFKQNIQPETVQNKSSKAPAENLMKQPETEKVPASSLLAYMSVANKPDKVEVKFYNTLSLNQMREKYGLLAKQTAQELAKRAGKQGQVLNWINILPETQIKRLDEIYALADSMKQNNPEGTGKLGIIGIGGSKHTIENLLSLTGNSDKAVFLSAVDPESITSFVKKLGDTKSAAVMVASKSGTTLEPSVDFEAVKEALGKDFTNYVCITDKDEKKSRLRQTANEKGYKCGIIHDECGGRFGAFDDHTLTALAYCGMPKEDMKKMLEASLKAQKRFLNPDITNNTALQRAVFNTDSVLNNKQNQYDYYFSDRFEGTALWNTQMKKESHKSLYKVSGDLVGPAFLHNSTEADLDEGNTTSFYTFNTLKNPGGEKYKAYNALVNGSLKAYSGRHPLSLVELKDLSPETIGEFVEMKHFEAMYTGMMLRKTKNNEAEHPDVLPEVVQPHVKIYKNEVEKILKN